MFNRVAVIASMALAIGAAAAKEPAAAAPERAAPAAAAVHADHRLDKSGEAGETESVGTASSAVLRFEVRGDVDAARAAGAWPVREYEAAPIYHRPKATRHRKEYPNVMGIKFADWLAAQDAASSARQDAQAE